MWCGRTSCVDGYVRPLAWRGSEQMGVAAQATKINLAIAAWDWGSYFDPAARTKGLRLTIGNYRRPDPRTAPAKSKAAGLYMICTIEKHRAEREGYADALMLDWRGQIAEATGANIFFVKDGVLHTPLPDCFLDGITRRTVIGLAKQRGLKVIERAIMPEEMADFSECFITGTAAEVTPVAGDRAVQLHHRRHHAHPDGRLFDAGASRQGRARQGRRGRVARGERERAIRARIAPWKRSSRPSPNIPNSMPISGSACRRCSPGGAMSGASGAIRCRRERSSG